MARDARGAMVKLVEDIMYVFTQCEWCVHGNTMGYCIYIHIYICNLIMYIYIPRPSKGLRFGTPIECALRGYVSTPLSRTKKTQQDMVTTILIAPFLGETLGGELNNKKNDLGKSDTQMTRSPW